MNTPTKFEHLKFVKKKSYSLKDLKKAFEAGQLTDQYSQFAEDGYFHNYENFEDYQKDNYTK